MKRLLMFIIIFFSILAAAAPYVEGLLFKNVFFQRVAFIKQQLLPYKNIKVEVVSYEVGWLKSSVKLKVVIKNDDQLKFPLKIPLEIDVDSLIAHGPLIYDEDQLKMGSASMVTMINLSSAVAADLGVASIPGIEIHSFVTLDTTTWKNHFVMHAIGSSGGIIGDTIIHRVGNQPATSEGTFAYGGFMRPLNQATPDLPQMEIMPLDFKFNMKEKAPPFSEGETSFNAPEIKVTWTDGSVFKADQLNFKSVADINHDRYSFNYQLMLKNLNLPANALLTEMSNINMYVDFRNFSMSGMQAWESYARQLKPGSAVDFHYPLKIFLPDSVLSYDLSFDSNLGAGKALAKFTLNGMPTTPKDAWSKINIDIHLRMPRVIIDKLMLEYATRALAAAKQKVDPSQAALLPADPAVVAQETLNGLQQNKVLVIDQNDYVIVLIKKDQQVLLNDNDISPQVEQYLANLPNS